MDRQDMDNCFLKSIELNAKKINQGVNGRKLFISEGKPDSTDCKKLKKHSKKTNLKILKFHNILVILLNYKLKKNCRGIGGND